MMIDNKWEKIIEKIDFALQPIVNVKSGKLYGVEALLRNQKEAGGFYSIFNFFDEAFHDGVLYQVDLVLRKKALEKFEKLKFKNIQLFYNLDNRLLYMPDFKHGNTNQILKGLDLDKKSICFELSEKGTLQNSNALTTMLNRYKQEGFDIAIDDFGTGISGLQILYYAEADYIKIDRFFIQNIQNDSKKKLFCSSIINMAHIMGMKVIAEGIETKEEYYTCKDINVDFIQGYFIQKPKVDSSKIMMQYEEIKKIYKNDKRNQGYNLIDKTKIEYIEPIHEKAYLRELLGYFKKYPENLFVPVIDSYKQLCGVIYEKDIKKIAYSQYGISLAKNDTSDDKLKSYMQNVLAAEITWGVDKILEIYNTSKINTNGIFITKNNQYYGFIDVNSLLAISYNRSLEIAQDQNPLTKLPGNTQIEKFVDEAFSNINKKRYHIVYFDFNDFKPFNDDYGFRQGDRAILIFADILKIELPSGVFAGHIGGDDFFLGFINYDFDEVYSKVANIQRSFKEKVVDLYNKDDKQRGFTEGKDRFGVFRRFDLLSVSCVLVELRPSTTKESFDSVIGIAKKQSKKIDLPYAISIL